MVNKDHFQLVNWRKFNYADYCRTLRVEFTFNTSRNVSNNTIRLFQRLLMQLICRKTYDTALYSIIILLVYFIIFYILPRAVLPFAIKSSFTWLYVLYAHVRSYATWIFAWNWLHDVQHRQAYLNSNPPNSIYFTLYRKGNDSPPTCCEQNEEKYFLNSCVVPRKTFTDA